MVDTFTLDARRIPGVAWVDDGDNLVGSEDVKIINVLTPTAATNAANKSYVDAQVGASDDLVEDLTPQLGGNLDNNAFGISTDGNVVLSFATGGESAVNNVELVHAATGSVPIIRSVGADTNVDINVVTKGTGNIFLNLPTSDPSVTGALWNNAGVVTVSA